MAPHGDSSGWLEPLWPSRSDLFDLTGIILPSGTLYQSSNMIDFPPPWGDGEGAPRVSTIHTSYPHFFKYTLVFFILRCNYETSKKGRIRMIEIVLHKL